MAFFQDKEVDGIIGWHWQKTDNGAWDGPKEDWLVHHKAAIDYYCKHKRSVIQAGGNQGMYARLLADMFQNVYTFEPDHENFEMLSQNCAFPNIHKMQVALGADSGLIELDRPSKANTGMHMVSRNEGYIPIIALDSLVFRDLDLLFLDVEGYEINVLLGAANIIAKHHPHIIVERPSGEVVDLMNRYGYSEAMILGRDVMYSYNG